MVGVRCGGDRGGEEEGVPAVGEPTGKGGVGGGEGEDGRWAGRIGWMMVAPAVATGDGPGVAMDACAGATRAVGFCVMTWREEMTCRGVMAGRPEARDGCGGGEVGDGRVMAGAGASRWDESTASRPPG